MSVLPDISPYLPNPVVKNPVLNMAQPIQNNPVIQPFVPQRNIERVNGLDGANALNLGPNSSVLALDENLNVVWVIATDQNGTKTLVKGICLGEEYVPPKPVTMEDLLSEIRDMKSRVMKLEEGPYNGKHNQQSSGAGRPDGTDSSAGNRNGSGNSNGKPNKYSESGGPKNEAGA